MTDDTGARARSDRDTHQPVAGAADAVRLAPRYVAAVIDRHPTQITGVAPTDEGWIVEAEVVEDRRIPSTADILALYEIELDTDGELLAYRRTRRYLRGQRWSPEPGARHTMNRDGVVTAEGQVNIRQTLLDDRSEHA
jgi:hypothetical protein